MKAPAWVLLLLCSGNVIAGDAMLPMVMLSDTLMAAGEIHHVKNLCETKKILSSWQLLSPRLDIDFVITGPQGARPVVLRVGSESVGVAIEEIKQAEQILSGARLCKTDAGLVKIWSESFSRMDEGKATALYNDLGSLSANEILAVLEATAASDSHFANGRVQFSSSEGSLHYGADSLEYLIYRSLSSRLDLIPLPEFVDIGSRRRAIDLLRTALIQKFGLSMLGCGS